MERNIDKLRRLEKVLVEKDGTIAYLRDQLQKEKKARAETVQGVDEVYKALELLYIGVAVEYGSRDQEGGYSIILSNRVRSGDPERYRLTIKDSEGRLTVRAIPKKQLGDDQLLV